MKFVDICPKCNDESLIIKESYRYNLGPVLVSRCHCGYESIKPLYTHYYNYKMRGDINDYK